MGSLVTMSPLYPCGTPCSTGTHNGTVKILTLLSVIINGMMMESWLRISNPMGMLSVLQSFYHICRNHSNLRILQSDWYSRKLKKLCFESLLTEVPSSKSKEQGKQGTLGHKFKIQARGVHNMLRVRVCAAHMGGFLGPKFSKQGSHFGRFSINKGGLSRNW